MTNRMSESGLAALREIDDGLAANAARHIELLQTENDALRALLKCVADNLEKGMSKSMQELQSRTIRQELK